MGVAVIRSDAPHLVDHKWLFTVTVWAGGVMIFASIATWQHPDGPFCMNCISPNSIGTGVDWFSSSVSESDEDSEDVSDESTSVSDITSLWGALFGSSWKYANDGSQGISRVSGNSFPDRRNGGSGIAGCPPLCKGRVGRQPRRTSPLICCCNQTASTVSSRLYSCVEPAVWCPWRARAWRGSLSCAAADSIVTLSEWRVSPCASIADKVGDVQGVCAGPSQGTKGSCVWERWCHRWMFIVV